MLFGTGTFLLAQSDELEQLDGLLAPEALTAADWVAAGVSIVLAWLASVVIARLVKRTVGRRPDDASQQLAKLISRVVRIAILAVGIAVALSFIGLDLGWLTVIVILLLVFGYLIARPLLEGLSAGLSLALRPAFDVGDDIGVEDFEGRVIDITQRSTVLKLRDGRHVHYPNADVLEDALVVFTEGEVRRTSLEIEIDERAEIAAAERVIETALAAVESITDDPAPVVRAVGFGNASVKLSVRFWHAPDLASGSVALDQAVRAVHKALHDAGIDMSTPHHVEVRPA